MKATNLVSRVLQLLRAAGGGGAVVGAAGGVLGAAGVAPGGGWAYSVTLQRAFIAAAPAASGHGVEREAGGGGAAACMQLTSAQLSESGALTLCAATSV